MTDETRLAAERLVADAGIKGQLRLHALPGGGNNRGYRVDVEGQRLFLKAYFQHPADTRDRLDAEFSFSTYAWQAGLRCLPRPIACDRDAKLGLYEFVDGVRVTDQDISRERVQAAARFFAALNEHRDSAGGLRLASEASFSTEEHLHCIQSRVESVQQAVGAANREFARFVRHELVPQASELFAAVQRLPSSRLTRRLLQTEWRVSPSDFGFHNMLLHADGRLRFVDFEYAGWDDPAKMLCDFFCQVQVPVDEAYLPGFFEVALESCCEPQRHLERMRLLMPLYRVKWCCILLNEFLPAGAARRRFAGVDDSPEVRQTRQLAKARAMLESLAELSAA